MLVFGRAKIGLYTFRIWGTLPKVAAIGTLIHMTKPALKIVSPATVKRKVAPRRPKNADVRTREYLTEKEVEKLIEGCEGNRQPHRDQTMIRFASGTGCGLPRFATWVHCRSILPVQRSRSPVRSMGRHQPTR